MRIPEKAKKVFKGEIFDVYQWQQEMFDGSEQTFEAVSRLGTIQVIPIVGDKIILAREQQPLKEEYDTFIGGRQEDGEDVLVSAKRELLEETGLESDDWELLRTYEPSGKISWTIYEYVARNCKKVAEQNLDSGEKITLREVDFDEFVEIVSSRDFRAQLSSMEVYRMKHEGGLEDYRKTIFGT